MRLFYNIKCFSIVRLNSYALLILAILLPAHAAQKTLTGRIMDWNGNGVSDAVVTLLSAHLQTTTDYTGYFSFAQSTSARGVRAQRSGIQPQAILRSAQLEFAITNGATPVTM